MPADRVVIGLVTAGSPQLGYVTSLAQTIQYDAVKGGKHLVGDVCTIVVSSGPSLAGKRNNVVKAFLDETAGDWLLFIDDDQTFTPDLVDRLVESADPVERPIVSALIMADRGKGNIPIGPACTIYLPDEDKFVVPSFIPEDRHWQVSTIGTGCVLIHRSVLEDLRDRHKDDAFPWFKHGQRTIDGFPSEMSEDYVFSIRCAAAGYPVIVDTTIECGHIKQRTLTTADYYAQPTVLPPPRVNIAVIPVKGLPKWTKGLVRQLQEDPDCNAIIVIDNGMGSDLLEWLFKARKVSVLPGHGMGIHEMWNLGVQYACDRPNPVNVYFLNNDVQLESGGHVGALAEALEASDEMVAVCPNYDHRPGEGVERLHGICAERYDGTGGLAGFGFMVKGELFTAAGYRFPEQCKWWYGDTDMVLTIDAMGGWYGMTHAAAITHLGGGGNTGKWDDPKMQRQLAKDRAFFEAKWSAPKDHAP